MRLALLTLSIQTSPRAGPEVDRTVSLGDEPLSLARRALSAVGVDAQTSVPHHGHEDPRGGGTRYEINELPHVVEALDRTLQILDRSLDAEGDVKDNPGAPNLLNERIALNEALALFRRAVVLRAPVRLEG